ncbi:hypothetical protein I5T93_06685 [Stenotrophomonas maltophilia]|nr:hypothetical protein [Stenotrophomonas maltophilia]MCI1052839.1 hypothetical protein [Stenotrophomonas maltophilia]
MCYSAQITAAYQKLVRMTGATLSLQEFAALHVVHPEKNCPETPKAMEGAFGICRSAGRTQVERTG